MIKIGDKKTKGIYIGKKPVKEVYKGSSLLWRKVKGIELPMTTDVFNTPSNYMNRTTGVIKDNKYIVTGYQENTGIDTSFGVTTKDYITLPPNTMVYLSFDVELVNSQTDVYFKRRYQANQDTGKVGACYGTCCKLTGKSEANSCGVANLNAIVIGKNYQGRVALPIQTHDDTEYKVTIGFDDPNLYGVGSQISFSNIEVSTEPLFQHNTPLMSTQL